MRLDPRARLCFFARTGGVCTGARVGVHWWVWGALGSPCSSTPHVEQPATGKRHWASDIHRSRAPSPPSAWTRQYREFSSKPVGFPHWETILVRGKVCLGKAEVPKFLSKTLSQPSCGTSRSKRRERQPRKGTGAHKGQFDPGFGTNRLWRVCAVFSFVAVAVQISPDPLLALHFTFTASMQIVGVSQSVPFPQTYTS